MDQKTTNNESVPFELPPEQAEVKPNLGQPEVAPEADANNIAEKSMAKAVESGTVGNPFAGTSNQTLQQDGSSVDPSILIPQTPTSVKSTGKQITILTDDLQAADTDLIEKAWVVKAKAIVEKTRDNPYEQTKEIKKIKADYQKKRFNNDLKINDE